MEVVVVFRGFRSRDGLLVIAHHLPQKHCSGKHGNAPPPCCPELRVVGMDSCRVHHCVNLHSCLLCLSDIFRPLSDIYHGSLCFSNAL